MRGSIVKSFYQGLFQGRAGIFSKKQLLLVVIFLFIFYFFIPDAVAVRQLISLQGKITYQGALIPQGGIMVTIHDSPTGMGQCYPNGTAKDGCMFNSTTTYNLSIVDSFFDVMLGSLTPLDLNYNQYYWIDIKVKLRNQTTWTDLDWNETGIPGLQERKKFESVSGDTFANDIQINNGSFFICQGGSCPSPLFLGYPYEGDLFVENNAEIRKKLFVYDTISVGNRNHTSYNYNIFGNATIGAKEPRAIPYIKSREDVYISGNLAVGDNLFADTIIGTSMIDADSYEAFKVCRAGSPNNCILIVDTIRRRVTIQDNLTVNDTITLGSGYFENYSTIRPTIRYHIIGNASMAVKEPRGVPYVTSPRDLYIDGSLAVGDYLFADTIIGTTTVDITSKDAFTIQPYGEPNNWLF
ncbi:MAG: hypothetical protein QW594_04600, partial [Candidatus Woesearchaeota archaeon]